jgi:hypothetical protein
MTEQSLFELYLSGSITHAQYIGNLKQINEKYIQNQSSKTSHGGRTSKQQEITSMEEDTWFI